LLHRKIVYDCGRSLSRWKSCYCFSLFSIPSGTHPDHHCRQAKIFHHAPKNSHSTAQRKFHRKRPPQPEKVKDVIIQSFTKNEDYITVINKDDGTYENTGVSEGAGRQQENI
jgi:hypothetical protein